MTGTASPTKNQRLPYWLLLGHSLLVLFLMFALSQRWLVSEPPFDCFYIPFLITSGPVYLLAHLVQHKLDGGFTPEQTMLAWNIVPGTICLVLGGVQWFFVGVLWLRFQNRRRLRLDEERLGAANTPQ